MGNASYNNHCGCYYLIPSKHQTVYILTCSATISSACIRIWIFCVILLCTNKIAVVLSVLVAVAGCGCPNSLIIYCRGMDVWALWKIPAISASQEDATPWRNVLHLISNAPFTNELYFFVVDLKISRNSDVWFQCNKVWWIRIYFDE